MRPLTRSCFLLPLLGRLSLLALPFLLRICPRSLWSPPFPLHAPAVIPSLLPGCGSLPSRYLVLWTDGSFPFDKGGSGILANCSLCDTEITLSFSAGPVCSSFSAEAWAILQALCWFRQHQEVCHFSSPPIGLSFCPRHSVFSSIFPFTLISGKNCFLFPLILSGYNGSPDTRFSRETTRLMN